MQAYEAQAIMLNQRFIEMVMHPIKFTKDRFTTLATELGMAKDRITHYLAEAQRQHEEAS